VVLEVRPEGPKRRRGGTSTSSGMRAARIPITTRIVIDWWCWKYVRRGRSGDVELAMAVMRVP